MAVYSVDFIKKFSAIVNEEVVLQKSISKKYGQLVILSSKYFCLGLVSIDYILTEKRFY